MYVVVGCSDCSGLWIVTDPRDQETATCARCGSRHRTDRLRRLFEAEERETAVEARGTMLARRAGESESFEAADDATATAAGMDDAEFLAASGLDPDEVAAAGERAAQGAGSSGSGDRASVVRAAVTELDEPAADEVVDYAAERGVPADAARDLLDRLHDRGEVRERDGCYRPL
ncbi:MAG: DUF5817 domain-containing protein [Haloferacaceae archaeon]